MSLFQRLVAETEAARTEFLSIPLIRRAVAGNVSRALYRNFLNEAYHHVRHTCPLLSFAAAKTTDAAYRKALFTYLDEEQGHEDWILSDMMAIVKEDDEACLRPPRPPCRSMVGYAYYAIGWISPYALLGMIHVLEGMSMQLATQAARALQKSFGIKSDQGFVYLLSHGSLDIDHAAFFAELIDQIGTPAAADVIIDCANMMYWLYGNIFRDLERFSDEVGHVARG